MGKPIVVIPNPLPSNLDEVARKPVGERALSHHAADGVQILATSRLVSGKGVDVVLEGLPSLPFAYNCTIAGDGPERWRLQAMAYGIPVVAVRSRGVPDVALDGRTGFLVDTPEPVQVAEAVQKLADPKTRE